MIFFFNYKNGHPIFDKYAKIIALRVDSVAKSLDSTKIGILC